MNTDDGSEIFVCTVAQCMHKFTAIYAQSQEYTKRVATDVGSLTAKTSPMGNTVSFRCTRRGIASLLAFRNQGWCHFYGSLHIAFVVQK